MGQTAAPPLHPHLNSPPVTSPNVRGERGGALRLPNLLQRGLAGRRVAIPDSCQAFGSPFYRSHCVRDRFENQGLHVCNSRPGLHQ